MALGKRLMAEFLGTFWLVFGGCGSAVLAAMFLGGPANTVNLGISFVGVSFAFGLTVLTMAYAVGHISGGHFNPAVSVGLLFAKRFPLRDLAPYIVTQIIGGTAGAGVLYLIASGKANFGIDPDAAGAFATNGYGALSPGGYTLLACLICEVVLTFFFLIIILGATSKRAAAGMAPLAIGLGLTLIHLIGIPVTNTSVNPARSTAVAVFVGGAPLMQLWLFWLAPIVGAALAGIVWRMLDSDDARTA